MIDVLYFCESFPISWDLYRLVVLQKFRPCFKSGQLIHALERHLQLMSELLIGIPTFFNIFPIHMNLSIFCNFRNETENFRKTEIHKSRMQSNIIYPSMTYSNKFTICLLRWLVLWVFEKCLNVPEIPMCSTFQMNRSIANGGWTQQRFCFV